MWVTFANTTRLFNICVLLIIKAGFFEFAPEEYETVVQKAFVLAAFGHHVEDKQLKIDALERNGVPTLKMKLLKQRLAFKYVTAAKKRLIATIKKFDDLDLLKGRDFDDSKQMFEVMSKHLYLMAEVCLNVWASIKIELIFV